MSTGRTPPWPPRRGGTATPASARNRAAPVSAILAGKVTRHLVFEAAVGNLYLTRTGRVVRLVAINNKARDAMGSPELEFLYVGLDNHTPDRQGAQAAGFAMHERTAAKCMTRIK